MVFPTVIAVKKDDWTPWKDARKDATASRTYIDATASETLRALSARNAKRFSRRAPLKPCVDLNMSTDTFYRILTCLTEGTGIRATAKINDVYPATVLREC